MLITLKSFEKIGNLTNKLNVLQSGSYTNRSFLESLTAKKLERISDYTEDDAQKVISLIEEKIEIFANTAKKSYGKFYDEKPGSKKESKPLKKGVSKKTPMVIT